MFLLTHQKSASRLWLCVAVLAIAAMSAGHAYPESVRPQTPTPLPAPAHAFHFAVLGDSQFHDPAGFNRLVNDMVWLSPAFAIQVGDMIQGYAGVDQVRKEWQRFADQIKPLSAANISFLPVPGNHDMLGAKRKPTVALKQVYEQTWGATYYQFLYGNSAFIILNTDEPGASGRVSGAQLRWLEQTLIDTATLTHRFVFMHRPPDGLRNAKALHALFVRHGVHTVFYGHHHHYHFRRSDGVQYVMTNAAANSATELPGVGSFDHLLQVSVRDDAVSIAVVRADSIQGPDTVAAIDNYDLFALRRGLFAEPPLLQPQAPTKDARSVYRLQLALQNDSKRAVRVYVHCASEDDRWQFTPAALPAVAMAAGTQKTVEMQAWQPHSAPASGLPTCTAQFPYQLANGQWHNRTVTAQAEIAE